MTAIRYGDIGLEVRALQRALLGKGFALPNFGADGDFGHETRIALERFAKLQGIAWNADRELPKPLIDALALKLETVDLLAPSSDVLDLEGVKLYDLRNEQRDPHPRCRRDRMGKALRRSPNQIDSIVLHQTAIKFSPPRRRSPQLDLARRALGVACHVMAFHDGFLTWPVDLTWYIHHADRLNSRSLGLEVDGNYPGLLGGRVSDPKANPETKLTDAVVHAARIGVKLLVEEGRRAGCPIRYIYAHRQSDRWRRADPGEGLWRRVVLEYAIPVLHLIPRQNERFRHAKDADRHGQPVPSDWDPDGHGTY